MMRVNNWRFQGSALAHLLLGAAVCCGAHAETAANATRGISSGGAVLAQTGSYARAQTGSGARGQTGSYARGQTGSYARAQTGSGARGQTGSYARGQTGSYARAQTGSGARGQTGSYARAQTGSGARGQTGSYARAQTGSYARGAVSSFAFESAAMGPVEAMETQDGVTTLTVLGQKFVDRSDLGASFASGDYVMAAGNGDGQLQVLYPVGSAYVPGASTVMVVGTIKAVNGPHSSITLGSTTFDYSSRLVGNPDYTPHSGELAHFTGTQPVPGGLVLVQGPPTSTGTSSGARQ